MNNEFKNIKNKIMGLLQNPDEFKNTKAAKYIFNYLKNNELTDYLFKCYEYDQENPTNETTGATMDGVHITFKKNNEPDFFAGFKKLIDAFYMGTIDLFIILEKCDQTDAIEEIIENGELDSYHLFNDDVSTFYVAELREIADNTSGDLGDLLSDFLYSLDDGEIIHVDDLDDFINEGVAQSQPVYHCDQWEYLRENNITDGSDAIEEMDARTLADVHYYYGGDATKNNLKDEMENINHAPLLKGIFKVKK